MFVNKQLINTTLNRFPRFKSKSFTEKSVPAQNEQLWKQLKWCDEFFYLESIKSNIYQLPHEINNYFL